MSFAIKARVDSASVKALLATMEGMKRGVRNRILRPAVRAGAGIIRDAARKKAPVDTGALRKSLTAVVRTGKRTGNVYAVIGPATAEVKDRKTGVRSASKFGAWLKDKGIARRPANYAHLVEYGTRPHTLAPGDRLATTTAGKPRGGGRQIYVALYHPGAEPKPFLRPALGESRVRVGAVMRQKIWAGLTKYYAKRAGLAA